GERDPHHAELVATERDRVTNMKAEGFGQPLFNYRPASTHPVPGGEQRLVHSGWAGISSFGVDRNVDSGGGEPGESDRERSCGGRDPLRMDQRGKLARRRMT